MAHPPGDAVGQQVGQGAVDGGVRLTEDERQLRRIDERRPAEGVEQLPVGDCHVLSVSELEARSDTAKPCDWGTGGGGEVAASEVRVSQTPVGALRAED